MNEPQPTELADAAPLAPVFSNANSFEAAQRMAKLLVASDFVPEAYRGERNLANAVIALEYANRLGVSPLAVMQHLAVIYGKPSLSSTMLIALVNACGRFEPLQFAFSGDPGSDDRSCLATTCRRDNGARCDGPAVSIKMAKAEGWYDRLSKKGEPASKWPNMPDLMLSYRAAAFFSRLYTPDVTLGMHSIDEIEDARAIDGVAERVVEPEPAPDPEDGYKGPSFDEIESGIENAKSTEDLSVCRDVIRDFPWPVGRTQLLKSCVKKTYEITGGSQ